MTSASAPARQALRERLRAGEPLVGCFVKTAAAPPVEILGLAGLDYAVLDAEHAPFTARELDGCILAARASGLPVLVRLPEASPAAALQVLDMGAAGIVVPHVDDAAAARRAVAMAHYAGGERGFSNSPRAGGYGSLALAEHVRSQDAGAVVVCQVESRAAVQAIDEIAAVPGVDCLLIGRADLAVSYGELRLDASAIEAAVAAVLGAGQRAGRATGIFLPDSQQVAAYRQRGATMFLIGSDQSLLVAGARALRQQFDSAAG